MNDARARIRTPRLRLDPLRPADATALHAHWTEPEVRQYLWDGAVVAKARVEEVIAASDALFAEEGAGLWAMRSPEGAFLGCAGFWRFHDPPELELLVSLAPDAWGTGLASEAARAVIDRAFADLDWAYVQASADSPNARSLKLIRSLGMRPAGERPGAFGVIEVFRLPRPGGPAGA